MNVRDAPFARDLTKQHRFDRAAVDCAPAIVSGDGFDAHNPTSVACSAVRAIDDGAPNGGAVSGIGGKMVAGIFGSAALDAAGLEDQHILGEEIQRGARVTAGQGRVESFDSRNGRDGSGNGRQGGRRLRGGQSLRPGMSAAVERCLLGRRPQLALRAGTSARFDRLVSFLSPNDRIDEQAILSSSATTSQGSLLFR